MKILIPFLTFLILLPACSPKPPDPAIPTVPATNGADPSAAALGVFEETGQESVERLRLAASAALKAGGALDSEAAERCLETEAERGEVRELCLLLWAGGATPSPVLEKALLAEAGNSRITAMAISLHPSLAEDLDRVDLLALMPLLSEDPPWLRARLANTWLQKNTAPPTATAVAIADWMKPSAQSGPFDWESTMPHLYRLNPALWQEALSSHCDARATGELLLRCWRFLAATAGAKLSPAMKSALAVHEPDRSSEEWTLFVRSFPSLSSRLTPFSFQENK